MLFKLAVSTLYRSIRRLSSVAVNPTRKVLVWSRPLAPQSPSNTVDIALVSLLRGNSTETYQSGRLINRAKGRASWRKSDRLRLWCQLKFYLFNHLQ